MKGNAALHLEAPQVKTGVSALAAIRDQVIVGQTKLSASKMPAGSSSHISIRKLIEYAPTAARTMVTAEARKRLLRWLQRNNA